MPTQKIIERTEQKPCKEERERSESILFILGNQDSLESDKIRCMQ